MSIAGEQGVLACLLLDPQAMIPEAQHSIGRGSDFFYDMRHQEIYDVLCDMMEKSKFIDMISFQQELKDRNSLEALGGMPYLSGLLNCTPSTANLPYYLEIVREKFVLRKMLQVCTSATAKIYESEHDAKGMLNDLQREIMEIDPDIRNAEEIDIRDLMGRVYDRIESYKDEKNKTRGIMTGFPDLDRIWNGCKGGHLIILAARPSIGKTSLAMNFVENIAIIQNVPCGFFSMEMEAEELGERLVSSRASIDGERIQRGDMLDDEALNVTGAIATICGAPIHICDKGGMTFPYFRVRARRMVQKHKIKLLVIDYLQLFSLPGKENRSIEIGAISTGLKGLAKELGITIICLSQLNRELEKENRLPRLSDLRDSGSIEQDADKVLLLSEEIQREPKKEKEGAKKKKPAQEKARNPDEIVVIGQIPKNRGGRRGQVRFLFRKPFTRFESISPIDDEDAPTESQERVFDIPVQENYQYPD